MQKAVPSGARTVQNYLALAAWDEREPSDFTRFGHLDTSTEVAMRTTTNFADRPIEQATRTRG